MLKTEWCKNKKVKKNWNLQNRTSEFISLSLFSNSESFYFWSLLHHFCPFISLIILLLLNHRQTHREPLYFVWCVFVSFLLSSWYLFCNTILLISQQEYSYVLASARFGRKHVQASWFWTVTFLIAADQQAKFNAYIKKNLLTRKKTIK